MRLDLAGESKRSILDSFWLSPALFILECGGPAPLWPVLSTASQAVLAAKRFRAWETIASVGQSAATPACPVPLWPVLSTANQVFWRRSDFAPGRLSRA